MKRIFLLALLGCMATVAFAQNKATNEEYGTFNDRLTFGFKGGVNFANMHYTYDRYNELYDHSVYVRPNFGMFLDIAFNNGLSLRPEFNYIGRGVKLDWADINYKMNAFYYDFRLPIVYTFCRESKVRPYLLIAPTFGMPRYGNVTYNSNATGEVSTELSTGSIAKYDFSGYGAFGMNFPIEMTNRTITLGFEVGYNLGFINTFSEVEMDREADRLNTNVYEAEGKRYNRGVEAAIRLGFPLKRACHCPKAVEVPVEVVRTVEKEVVKEVVKEVPTEKPGQVSKDEVYNALKDANGRPAKDNANNDGSDDIYGYAVKVNFELNDTVLSDDATRQLDAVVKILKIFPDMNVRIVGHTDNTATDKVNQPLSERRALVVYNYFLERGINASRMTKEGKGSKYPIDTNATEEGRANNRRAEITLIAK